MTISATFINNRCFFNGFTPATDINSKGKAGLGYCRYNFIGAILAVFGFTYRIRCQKNNIQYNCYIYAKSFKNWIKHKEEFLDNPIKTTKKITSYVAEKYIKKVCDNKNQIDKYLKDHIVNPGKPLSVDKVIEKVKQDFAHHQDKNEILESIKKLLISYGYKETHKKLRPPSFVVGADAWQEHYYQTGLNGHESNIYLIARNFVSSLPGVDITPHSGDYLK